MNHITIYIIRHCEPLLPRSTERIFIGQTDIPLSEAGIQHARALSLAFKDIVIEKIYSSDLIRSRHTAQLIAERHGIAVRNKPGLNEINLGTWEGLHVSEIMTNYPGEYEKRGEDIVRYRTPGGESFLDCSHRVLECFFTIITKATGTILIVGHAGVNRIILSHVMGTGLENIFTIEQRYGCINVMRRDDTGITIRAINNTGTEQGFNSIRNTGPYLRNLNHVKCK